jgi:uncharacterized protein
MVSSPASIVAVRVRPGASRARVGGRYDGPLGPALVVAVTEPAVDGRATDAVIRSVAAALGVRRAEVSLRTGQASRDKLLAVAGDPTDLDARVTRLRDGAEPGR